MPRTAEPKPAAYDHVTTGDLKRTKGQDLAESRIAKSGKKLNVLTTNKHQPYIEPIEPNNVKGRGSGGFLSTNDLPRRLDPKDPKKYKKTQNKRKGRKGKKAAKSDTAGSAS